MALFYLKGDIMANKKYTIDFKSNGIGDIIRELNKLKEEASKVILSQELDDQISSMGRSAEEVKEALNSINETLNKTGEKKKKSKQISEMDKQLEDLKTKIKALDEALKGVSSSIDANVTKIANSLDRINGEDAFKGLLDQMNKVNDMFDKLKQQTSEFKTGLKERDTFPLTNASNRTSDEPKKKGRPKGPDYSQDELYAQLVKIKDEINKKEKAIEIDRDLSSDDYVKVVGEIADDFNDALKERNDLIDKIIGVNKKTKGLNPKSVEFKEVLMELRELQAQRIQLEKKLAELGKAYEQYVYKEDVYDDSKYNLRINDLEETARFKDISNMMIDDMTAWKGNDRQDRETYDVVIKRHVKEFLHGLTNEIKVRMEQIRTEDKPVEKALESSVEDEVNKVIDENFGTAGKQGRPKKDIQIGIQIKQGEKAETISELQKIIDEINATNPHIDLNINLVSDYIMKNRESLVSQLNKQIEGIDDEDIKKDLQALIPKIDKTFKGDLKLNIASNIDELAKEVPGAIRVIQREVAMTPIPLYLQVDQDDIRKQVEKMGKLSIPIGEITLSQDLYKNIKSEVEDVAKKTEEATSKAKKQTKQEEESVAVALNNTIAKFIQDLTKLPTIVKGLYETLGNIPISAEIQFDAKQVQEALDSLEGLSLKIDKIDASKAVLDKLKLDVKGGIEELIPVGKTLVVEIMRLCNMLTPFQRQIKAIVSDDSSNVTNNQSMISQDISRYLRDGLTALVNITGNIESQLSKLDNLKVQLDTVDTQEKIETAPTQITLERNPQFDELIEATSAVVRAIHIVNKQMVPLQKLSRISNDGVSIKKEAPSTTKVEMPDEYNTSIQEIAGNTKGILDTAKSISKHLDSFNDDSYKSTSQKDVNSLINKIGLTPKGGLYSLSKNNIGNVEALLRAYESSNFGSLKDFASHYDISDGNVGVLEKVAKQLGIVTNGDLGIGNSIGKGIEAGTDDVKRSVQKVMENALSVARESTKDFNKIGEEAMKQYGKGVKKGQREVSKDVKSAIEQGIAEGTVKANTSTVSKQTPKTKNQQKRESLQKDLQKIIEKEYRSGQGYNTDAYITQARDYLSALKKGRGNVTEIDSFVKGKDRTSNVTADIREVEKTLVKVDNLLKKTTIPDSAKKSIEHFRDRLVEVKNGAEITLEEFEKINNELKKSDKTAEDYLKDLNKIIATEQNGQSSTYTNDFISRAKTMRDSVNGGDYNGLDVESFINSRMAASNLRGNKTSLENMMIKAEKMLATNYLPGNLQNQLKDVIGQMRALDGQADVSKESIDALARSFRTVEAEAARAGKTFIGQVGQRLKDMNAKFIAQYLSIQDLIRYFRSMISTITELDTALTEMRKVSDESLKSLKEYQKTTFDTAGALGTTAVQLQQSTADWMRLGETMEQAAKSAQSATTLLNVSEFESINDATTALVAMSQAYKDMDKTEIIDVLNNIGNNYSIATDQLATALQQSSSALMTQGNDLYEAAALVTAGNQVVQDALKTGTGIRTIALRIAGNKMGADDLREELAELGEEVDDWVVSTEAKKREVIMEYTKVASNGGMGVDILDTNGNLKDTYHILLEISKVYKEIQEEDKKYGTNRAQALVEELAGKNRSNIAASILMNPEVLENVYNSALNSQGSAAEENAKYLDSIIGKTQQFKNELQELEQNLLSSDLIKDVLDFGTAVLSIVNQLGDKIPLLTAALGSLAFGIAATNKEWTQFIAFNKETATIGLFGKKFDYESWQKFTKQLRDLKKNWYGIIPHILEFPNKIKSLPSALKKMSSSMIDTGRTFAESLKNGFINNLKGIDFKNQELSNFFRGLNGQVSFDNALQISNLSKETKEMALTLKTQGVTSWEAYQAAETSAGVAAQFTSAAISVLNSVVTAGIALLATLAVSGAIKGIRKLANASKEAKEEFTKFNDELKETKQQIKSNKEYLDDNSATYVKLAKEVDSLGNNLSLSTEEFAKYNEISNEIAERFPELVSGWTEEGNAILEVRNNVRELNEAYEENKRLKLERLIAGDEDINPKSVIKNYKELKHANFFEMFASGFTHTKEAGKVEDYDYLDDVYSAFLKMSYEDYRKMYGYLEGDIKNLTEEEQQLIKSVTLGQNKKTALLGIDSTATEEEFEHARLLAQSQYDMMTEEMEEALRGYREIASTYLQLQPNYDSLDAQTKEIANKIINSLDQSLIDELQLDDPYKINAWVKQTLRSLDGLDKDVISDLFKVDTTDKNFKETVKESAEAYNKAIASIDAQISVSDDEYEIKRLTALKESLKEITGLADAEDFGNRFNNQLHSISNGAVSEYEMLDNYTKDFTREQMENWLNITDAEMSATEAIDAYENAIAKGTFSKFDGIGALLSQNTAIDDTSWKEIKNDLVGLAQAGKLDEQTLRDYKYFDEILKALGLTADVTDDQLSEMINDINKIAVKNAVDDLSNYKTEVDKLGDAYTKFKNGEFIDAGTLSALQDAFGDLDSYQAFEEAVLSGEQDLQHYFDDIVTEYANQHKILNELTDANKEWVKQQLVSSGITKESADAAVEDALKHKKALEGEVRAEIESLNSMDAIANGKKELAIDTANLSKMTIQEVSALLAETKATGEGVEALKYFAIEKELAKMTGIRNNDDIEYLIQLCELAGMGTSQLESLKRLGANSDKWVSQISEADAHLKQLGSRSDPGAVNERAYWNQVKMDAQNAQQKYAQGLNDALPNFREEFQKQYGKFQYDFSSGLDFSGVTDAAGEAGSEAAEAFKDALDKILAMYDAELDAGVITFQTYVDKSRQAIEQYYNEGKIKASEYYDYLANLYQKQVSEYDKVISAVQRLLKKQTDELQKQKEAIEESYNLQIEEIQKKIDALRDENDEIDKNMALQKAQYNLARAQNQRTKLMYSEARGFYYEADLKGVHDAQEEVRKAQLDKTIFDLEKQIKVLQDQMKKETDEIDKQIKALNEYAEAWAEVSSKLQNAIEDQRAAQILGQDWEKQILDQRLDTLQNFTNQYVALQQAQKDAYLAARQAEANAALSGGGSTVASGVKGGGSGGGGGDDNGKNKTPIVTQPGGSQGATHWKIQPSPPTSYYGQNITSSLGQLSGFTDAQNASLAANGLPAKIAAAAKKAASMSSDTSIKYLQGQARTNRLNEIYNEVLSEQKKKGYRAQSYFTGTDSAKSGEALVGEKGHEIVVGNDGIATIVNEPTLMKMQGGEKIFNADETDKILKKSVPLKTFNPKKFALLQSFANGTSSPMQTRIAAQAVGLANGLSTGMLNVQGAGGQTINQTFNVSLPNITDQSKASELFKEFEHMQMKATQFFNR